MLVLSGFIGAVSREWLHRPWRMEPFSTVATLAVSITGIAGPGGGSGGKAGGGRAHFACAKKNGATLHREERFGDIGRGGVREASVEVALDLLEAQLL